MIRHLIYGGTAAIMLLGVGASAEVILRDDFSSGAPGTGLPPGWRRYGAGEDSNKISVVDRNGKREVLIQDTSAQAEGGMNRSFPATGGKRYRVGVMARSMDARYQDQAYFQLRFLPGNQFRQEPISVSGTEEYIPNMIELEAPAGTTGLAVYIYTHKAPQPAVAIRDFILEDAAENFSTPAPWPDVVPIALIDRFRNTELDAKTKAPTGWRYYSQGPNAGKIEIVEADGAKCLKMTDANADSEIGISRVFKADPGYYYRLRVQARATVDNTFLGQISFAPGKHNHQVFFKKSDDFKEYTLECRMPQDAKAGVIYFYSHKTPVGEVQLRDFVLECSPEPFKK